MTKNDSNPEPDPLSATGMFLRAVGSKPAASEPGSEQTGESSPVAGGSGMKDEGAGPSAPGEFTRLFQARPAENAESAEPGSDAPSASASQPSAENPEPGEFTRIFLSGSGRVQPSPKIPDDSQRTRNSSGRAKGFSSPGASDSASAEGGFTQLFRPIFSGAEPPSKQSEAGTNSGVSARDNGRLDSGTAAPRNSSPSITNLMESLVSSGGSSREPETADGPLFPSAPLASAFPGIQAAAGPEARGPGSGGVTQFIRKLAEEPAAVVSAPPITPPPPAVPAANAGPGEYTRVIARVEEPAIPAIPRGSLPAASGKVAPTAGAIDAGLPGARIPPAPKVAAPPMPAITAPKSKLEAMAPALLAINTVLLIAVLAVLLLLLHAK